MSAICELRIELTLSERKLLLAYGPRIQELKELAECGEQLRGVCRDWMLGSLLR